MLPLHDHLPTRIPPLVNYALIAANVCVFALEVGGTDVAPWALVPARLTSAPSASWPTLFTARLG